MATKKIPDGKFIHLVRYGTAGDQKYLLDEFLNTYDLVVLNANIVLHTPAAISSFLFQHSLSKPFIIDPQTYAFGLDLKFIKSKSKGKSKGNVKKPFVKMADKYGEVFKDRLTKGTSLDSKIIKREKETIVNKVCEFQLNYLENQAKEDDVEKYYEFSEEEGDLTFNRTPEYLIPPYFYLDTQNYAEWLSVNIDLIEETIRVHSEKKITPQLVISKELLHSQLISHIIDAYSKLEGIHAILIWIDDHNETDRNQDEIEKFVSLISSLGKKHKIINLYGGALSVILGKSKSIDNFIGACHSIEYGEVRAVSPVGGGIPVSKFYLPSAFKRFKFRDVISILKSNNWLKTTATYSKHVCACPTCKNTIKDSPDTNFELFGTMNVKRERTPDGQEISKQYPTAESKDLCKRHYMHCKHFEYSEKKFEKLPGVVQELKDIMKSVGDKIPEEVGHLKIWLKYLEKLTHEKK